MATLFISDLHLDAARPAIIELFVAFLQNQARGAEALYILGDLFEAWIGDDDDAELGRHIATELHTLVTAGTAVYFVHGNRDFLLGERFAAASGMQLLPEATVIDLCGVATLIMHGDSLCTDDTDYQRFRAQVRNPAWQAQMLALPLAQRRAAAGQLRTQSKQAMEEKAEDITDVNQAAVAQAMREHGVWRLIHGHTHRPAVHEFSLDGHPAQRIVLGDWYDQGSLLRCERSGCHLQTLELSFH